jgi:putative aldouronate transport system permease protein
VKNRSGSFFARFSTSYPLYIFLIPSFIVYLILQYGPLFSNAIAFLDYNMFDGWMGLGSPFVGFKNFSNLFTKFDFVAVIGRSVLFSFILIVGAFPLSITLALFLNELKNMRFKKVVQTISYIPHFVSWVTVSGLIYIFLSVDASGLLNNLKVALVGGERVVFLADKSITVPLILSTHIWKNVGWGSILYLAAIATINPELYESAMVDGAGRWRRIFYITLPGILPTTIILLLLTMGNLFRNNFDQLWNLQNWATYDSFETIDLFVYTRGVLEKRYSLAAAAGVFQGVITFVFLMVSNYISRKLSKVSLF